MLRDKWGLPRKWRFWRDPIFWFYTAWAPATGFPLWLLLNSQLLRSLFSLEGLVLILVIVAVYGSVYWVIYDTYRWEHPERWSWFFIVLLFWALGLPLYLIRRQEWFQELIARRNRMI